jgi:regulator of sigma E protease
LALNCLLDIDLLYGLNKFAFILFALLILLFMVTIHEFGHYIAGKILKFKINEFSVGFGKAIFSKTKKNGEKFSIRIIPLGGYCAFEGEDQVGETENSFNKQKPWKRLIVLFSGVLFNFISAIIFSVLLLSFVGNGVPKVEAVEGINASIIFKDDVILEVNGKKPSFLNGGLAGLTGDIGLEEEVVLLVERTDNGIKQKIEIVVEKYNFEVAGKDVPLFGISTSLIRLNFGEALLEATPFTFEMAWECIEILGKLVVGQYGLKDIGGPITTINVIANASSASFLNVLLLLPLLAVNLAVFNVLPIPALDGARMIFVLIEWIRRKPIKRELEAKIHTIGLIVLFSFVILVDILHLLIY